MTNPESSKPSPDTQREGSTSALTSPASIQRPLPIRISYPPANGSPQLSLRGLPGSSLQTYPIGSPLAHETRLDSSSNSIAQEDASYFTLQPPGPPGTQHSQPVHPSVSPSRSREDSVVIDMERDKFDMEARTLVRRATNIDHKDHHGGILSSLLSLYGQPAKRKGQVKHRDKERDKERKHRNSTVPIRTVQSSATLSGFLLGSPMLFGNSTLSPANTPAESTRTSISDDAEDTGQHPLSFSLNQLEQARIKENIRQILQQHEFLMLSARALLTFGVPSNRLEENMHMLADYLCIDCYVANLPGLLLMAFNDAGTHTSETHMIRVGMGTLHMDRLRKTNQLLRSVMASETSVSEAIEDIQDMMALPLNTPWYVTIVNYGVGSFVVAPLLFQGSWLDAVVSGGLGVLIGALSLVADRVAAYANVFQVSAAVFSGLVASLLSSHVCYWGVVLSALVNLLPGLSLTLAVTELASRNIISGSVRLFYSLIVAFLIGFGLTLGTNLYTSAGHTIPTESYTCQPVSKFYWFLLFPIAATSFNLYLQANYWDYIPMTLISAAGFTVSHFATMYFDSDYLAPAIASFVIATLSNLYSRFFHQMAINNILAGILMLVPGSLGVKGSLALLTEEKSQAYLFALQMVIISLSVSVGLFASSLVVYPMGKKHNVIMTI
ncbi:pheromone-regulated protein prm10 [Dispira simplex]|nr:pheromone-regulated protein prm10 [Dispira simplex]